MGMQSLLRKVFLIDLLQGLKVTFRYQDPKEIYTEQYPMERPQVAERYRGAPRLNVNPDTDETMCIACDLCALACPENLIVVSSARNEQTRRKELTNFTYDLSRCMFCGLCEDACPVDALELTQDFELASYTREGWIWDREDSGTRSAAYAVSEVAASFRLPRRAVLFTHLIIVILRKRSRPRSGRLPTEGPCRFAGPHRRGTQLT